jgi:hypothetical protein
MGLDELPDILLQNFVTHAKVTSGVELLFVQKKAIGTVQVAGRPGGLGRYVDSRGYFPSAMGKALKVEKLCNNNFLLEEGLINPLSRSHPDVVV